MKTIHLNLASRPYRDYTAVYAVAILTGMVTAILMIYNIETASRYMVGTRHTRATIAATEVEIAKERRAVSAVQQSLSGVDTAALNDEARFINVELAKRSFSWSRLLDQLERVFPQDVRLTQLNPHIDKSGHITMDMICMSKSSDGMVRLINRLMTDPHFRRPFPRSENITNQEYQFNLGTEYIPEPAGVTR